MAETHRRVEVGDLPPLDAEQAETQLQITLTMLTAAREVYAARQNALKVLLTDDFIGWVETEIAPTDALLALPPELHRAESFQGALRNRPDLAEARIAVEKSDVVVQFRRNQLFPSLDLVGRYGGLGIDDGLSGAMSDSLHFRNPEYFYGAVLSFPVTRTAERNNYHASKAAKELASYNLRRPSRSVLLQIADWSIRSNRDFSRWARPQGARTYAEGALGAEQKKLQHGLSTSFFVLQLQETLTTARNAEALALADYNKALAQLAFAEGSMLERHHFTVEVK